MEHCVFVKYNFKRVDGSTEKVRCLVDERKRCHDTQHNDIHTSDTQHNETTRTTLGITIKNFTISLMAFRIYQAQHNVIHHNDTLHYIKKLDTWLLAFRMRLSILTFTIMTLGFTIKSMTLNGIHYTDTQHIGIHHNGTRHCNKKHDNQHLAFSISRS
jgi:hypothetical protein